ncbi:oxygen-independent coproporphyrinogen III oxidase [Pseudooceanicola sediminis]|uniref:Coproporphyrinogen-III oxidase n=1 Tax=Pseudooceanicola sediminis TaxID=2211117 RepID=A0A399IXD4_9RHOB|nr:oxygen-independent coproporphyrinogen III oxidase [Pseudooceanicola sediminis]KAA2312919.1 oxygen-independent coproporphyrinogen III oxidase [Puniceibacterium sp. HSS470]RII37681.1 oxygen-independent coproporphyrinogen III oxidase [Pseudooceanicola sediminis]|tara:strand:- start:29646 stop:31001 length:1356 start_codon:yes stop_codon:yes gene_type:complete
MDIKTQLSRHGLFDAKVPRYTSYPTSPHFSDVTGPAAHADWIAAIPPGAAISLYIHVPFCRHLCWFCACRTQGTQSTAPVAAYLQTLLSELRMLKAHLPEGVALSRLHWGGGTPTLLTPAMMETLAGAIADVAPLAPHAEFSVEIDPNEVDDARLSVLSAAGMNRASIGVQDFDPQIQKCIGREQSYEVTRDVVAAIRDHGVYSLNADILYGLPHQTPGKITQSVQKLLSLSPDRVALYGYAHVPWMARRQSLLPADTLPAPEQRLALFEVARQMFQWDGYAEIGIDHFALAGDGLEIAQKAGLLRRNFQGYTDDTSDVLIGVGASSISRFPQGYTQNNAATSGYTAAIRNSVFSTVRGHAFTHEDRLHGRIIEALMCDFEVRTGELSAHFDVAPTALTAMFNEVAAQFPDLLRVTTDGLFIPQPVRPLTRMIARAFDRYDTAPARHSSAI